MSDVTIRGVFPPETAASLRGDVERVLALRAEMERVREKLRERIWRATEHERAAPFELFVVRP